MQPFTYLRVIFPVLAISLITSQALQISTPATKDSTILRSNVTCPACPDLNCYKCTLGHDTTLEASTGGLAYIRILVGFQLPQVVASSSITNCTVQFPAFTSPLKFPVNITVSEALSSDWNENMVTGENAPDSGDVFGIVHVPANTNPAAIDVTPACEGANGDGEFSIYVGTEFDHIEVWSKDSGNPAILDITFDLEA